MPAIAKENGENVPNFIALLAEKYGASECFDITPESSQLPAKSLSSNKKCVKDNDFSLKNSSSQKSSEKPKNFNFDLYEEKRTLS